MKKIWFWMSLLCLAALLAGCGGKKDENSAGQETTTVSGKEEQTTENTEQTTVYEEQTSEEEESTMEVPELAYKMAPVFLQETPDADGWTQATYVIELQDTGFDFGWEMSARNLSSGEEVSTANGYEMYMYPGYVCVTERQHSSIFYCDGEFDLTKTDRANLTVVVRHKGEIFSPENAEFTCEMSYQHADIPEKVFTVNAELSEISVNNSQAVHGFTLVNLQGAYFVPEMNAGGTCSGNNWDENYGYTGSSYYFISVGGAFDPKDYAGKFVAVKWNPETKNFEEVKESGGYPILCLTKTDEEGKLEVGVVCKTKTDDWSVPYEAYEGLIPAYKDGDKLMVFAWQF